MTDQDLKSPWHVNSPVDAARMLCARICLYVPACSRQLPDVQFEDLKLDTGMFFAAPVPETAAADGAFIQRAIDQAVKESEENGVSSRGKEVTPWLLSRVTELTEGKSLKSSTFTHLPANALRTAHNPRQTLRSSRILQSLVRSTESQ